MFSALSKARMASLDRRASGTTAWICAPYNATSSSGTWPLCWAAFRSRIACSALDALISSTWPRIWVSLRRRYRVARLVTQHCHRRLHRSDCIRNHCLHRLAEADPLHDFGDLAADHDGPG